MYFMHCIGDILVERMKEAYNICKVPQEIWKHPRLILTLTPGRIFAFASDLGDLSKLFWKL